MASKNDSRRSKAKALLEDGTLNANPEKVNDPKFQNSEFFDPRDIVQVKYEMIRRVVTENASITDVANEYGISRPTYYQSVSSFDAAGIAGLVPKKRGPREPHKLRADVLAFVGNHVIPGKPIRARMLAKMVQEKFGLDVHPRTIERALDPKKSQKPG